MSAEPSIADIQAAVCGEFGVTLSKLLCDRTSRDLARPRQVGMWLSVKLTSQSLPAIGRMFCRDHTTVMHSVEVVERCIFDCNAWGTTAIALYRRFTQEADQLSLGGL